MPGTTPSGTSGRRTFRLIRKPAVSLPLSLPLSRLSFPNSLKTVFPFLHRDVKIFIGAPGSSSAAGSDYVDITVLQAVAQQTRANFPISFGGVMFWDASASYANNRYDVATKHALTSGGSCDGSYVLRPCTAKAWSAAGSYTAGSTVCVWMGVCEGWMSV